MFKPESKLVLRVFILTFAFFAAVHLSLLFVTSIVRGDLSILNPIEFLGLSVVWPQLQNVRGGSILFWMVLVNTYFAIYLINIFNVQAIIRKKYLATKQRVLKLRAVSKLVDLLNSVTLN